VVPLFGLTKWWEIWRPYRRVVTKGTSGDTQARDEEEEEVDGRIRREDKNRCREERTETGGNRKGLKASIGYVLPE
jgi:hypothetical protein